MTASADNGIDLILLGKTGHGKSTTGNYILQQRTFSESDNTESDTFDIQVGSANRLGRTVKVVDGPGLCETRMNKTEAANKMVKDMGNAIAKSPLGFHALLLVIKFGNRFTYEEFNTIQSLKCVFGDLFVKDFCIIIFTHGDNLDTQISNNTVSTFEDWCHQQTGAIQSLLLECEHRAVIFNNMDDDKADEQLGKLLEIVGNLNNEGNRYTNDVFKQFNKEREMLLVRENAPAIRKEIQAKIDLLQTAVNDFKKRTEPDKATKEKLSLLKKDAQNLDVEIVTKDKETGVLQQLRQVIANILQNIDSHVDVMEANKEKREKEEALFEQKRTNEEARKQAEIERRQREQALQEQRRKQAEEAERQRQKKLELEREIQKEKERKALLEREQIRRRQEEQRMQREYEEALERQRQETLEKQRALERKRRENEAENEAERSRARERANADECTVI